MVIHIMLALLVVKSPQMEVESTTYPSSTSQNPSKFHRGHDITTKTIKIPQFSYAYLRLISETATSIDPPLDAVTVRSYLGSALSQFLGITGSAISIDILKVKGDECWIRVLREDLSPLLAAVGGWVGGSKGEGKVGWMVKGSGNWLNVLVAQGEEGHVWNE